MAKRKQQNLIKGTANHRRTEGDYMSTLLDTVTLEDWQDVVSNALAAAKQGDAQARAWLAQYLVGKPAGKAPTPLTVVVQQLNGNNPLVEKLAKPVIDQYKYPSMHEYDAWETQIKAMITAELAEKIPEIKIISSPEPERLTADFDGKQST
jgi:hypothetical protein